ELRVEPEGAQLRGDPLRVLLRRDRSRLPVAIAVEDRADLSQPPLGNQVERLPDLPLATLPVSDQAVDPAIEAVERGRDREPRRDRQALAERAGRRGE